MGQKHSNMLSETLAYKIMNKENNCCFVPLCVGAVVVLCQYKKLWASRAGARGIQKDCGREKRMSFRLGA
jgi:hypothetical protein